MAKRLWVFGCSFSKPFNEYMLVNNEDSTYNKYKKFMGGTFPPTWSELLAKKMGYELMNCAYGGSSNYRIINKFNTNCHKIEEGDIVIVQWTRNERFYALEHKEDELVEISLLEQCKKPDFTGDSLKEMFVHRGRPGWRLEIYDYMKMMDNMARLGKFKVFYWSADNHIINGENQLFKSDPRFLLTFAEYDVINYLCCMYPNQLTIKDDTNGEVGDVHFGVKGHQVLCDFIYQDLDRKNVI